jgi:coenzyme F420-reducing hydrogenase delta subunit/ferredoxin
LSTPDQTTIAHRALLWAEGKLNKIFGNKLNPLYHLGALGFYFFWVVAISGAYIYAFYKTGIELSYPSVEYYTNEQWYLGGIMRSLHRYASDAMVLVMLLHLLREYILGRYRGARWFAWVTGVILLWMIFIAGINGYWMVWDKLAQYSVVATVEWFDWLPIFSEPMARTFITYEALNDRFFTLISFAHVTVPLLILFLLWIHIMRISYPVVNPRKGLALGMLLMMLVLALILPVQSQGVADMSIEPINLRIDWFYLWVYPLLGVWTAGQVWALVFGITLLLCIVPWLPSKNKQIPIAEVSLKDCSGCRLCVADCPYEAVVMRQRTDGMNFAEEAVVVADRCVSCGICVGACPSSSPYRGEAQYVSGIEMPSMQMSALRTAMKEEISKLEGDVRIMLIGCDNAVNVGLLRSHDVAVFSLPCIAMLPPSFIEYALRGNTIDGVFLTGCREGDCLHRLGVEWIEQRLSAEREPHLRRRVQRERVGEYWAAASDLGKLEMEIKAFQLALSALPSLR